MNIETKEGDLLDMDVDAIVNPWNRNVIPWWLLIPQGVSGAIKKRGGFAPFRELGRAGPMPLGSAIRTCAGQLPFSRHRARRGHQHVLACVGVFDRRLGTNAVLCAERHGYQSLALPLIGAGSGGFDDADSEEILCETLMGWTPR